MTAPREGQVAEAFVSLATSLASGYDVVELLTLLVDDCARLLDVAQAGLLLADGLGTLHVMAASSEGTRALEVLQLQRAQGPCLDCFHSGAPVSAVDLEQEVDRWPQFVPAARSAGFASVHAVPMRLRDRQLGALGLFGASPGALNDSDLALGQALADVASVALVQDRAVADRTLVNEQLQRALNSRVILEQAKGVIAQSGTLDMSDSFAMLRRFARDHNRTLSDVAQTVVGRTLPAAVIIEYVRSRPTRRR